jgi:anti-sigma B factor antagonist
MTQAPQSTRLHVLLEQRPLQRATILFLAGELDVAVAPDLRRVCRTLPSAVLPNVVIDLRRVRFMDCSVLGAFVLAHRRAVAAGGRLCLVGTTPGPRRVLEIGGLDGVFCLHDALAPALEPGPWRHDAA